MKREDLLHEAVCFRKAIEKAKAAGEFISQGFTQDRMNHFPYDCCDDTADLFVHYLFNKYGMNSIRVDSTYYDNELKCQCGHSWQVTDGWIIDMTGDQFDNDPAIQFKTEAVYVGEIGNFHQQFNIIGKGISCGIESLNSDCHERMYSLYNAIMRHMD